MIVMHKVDSLQQSYCWYVSEIQGGMGQLTWYCMADEDGTEGPTDRRLRSVIASASGALSCSQVSLTATCSRPEGLQAASLIAAGPPVRVICQASQDLQ